MKINLYLCTRFKVGSVAQLELEQRPSKALGLGFESQLESQENAIIYRMVAFLF